MGEETGCRDICAHLVLARCHLRAHTTDTPLLIGGINSPVHPLMNSFLLDHPGCHAAGDRLVTRQKRDLLCQKSYLEGAIAGDF